MKRLWATARHISCQASPSAGTSLRAIWKMVSSALCHHACALSRTDSSTMASGLAALISRQNDAAGQSTTAT